MQWESMCEECSGPIQLLEMDSSYLENLQHLAASQLPETKMQ